MMHNEFREAGYRVFGINPIKNNGACGCDYDGCLAPGKHPVMSRWQLCPDWSDEQWETMDLMGNFDSGYGVLLNGLLVIDVDARNGGISEYEKLVSLIPEIVGAGLIVETGSGSGSKHLYFSIDPTIPIVTKHPDYKGIDFKSGPSFVVGPGSNHASGNKYKAVVGDPYEIRPAPEALIELLKKPETYRAAFDGKHVDLADADISDMLSYVAPDCDHDTWIKIGMAVHHATQGAGIDLWDSWSASSKDKYPGSDKIERRWHSFGKSSNPVTIGTLAHYAKQAGWSHGVTFDSGDAFSDYEQESAVDGLPFSIDGIDLLKPPGFVGQVAQWIEDQSRRPRLTLAVAGALTAIGNVAGLRYTDDKDGVTTNLFAFCVAGSRTGKESIQQAVAEIHRAAGIGMATHGAIKSEQEIIRNLMRHQAAFYVSDEIGITLHKIRNAQERGGASYLEGIVGMLMSAYSKADSSMLLTGDARDEMQQALQKEAAQINKQIDAGNGNEDRLMKRLSRVEQSLGRLDKGLDRPFLSLIGFTTPVTFDDLADYHSATNGFIGRALIFNERETVPRSKRRFKKRPMPDMMRAAIQQIYSPGEFDMLGDDRVEYYEKRHEVVTDEKAVDMLEDALDWFEDQAEAHKAWTGLESLYLGAYELVSKVSLILACPEGRRTPEHVRWAFALVRNDLESKARLVTANDRADDSPDMALRARIANIIDGDGEKLSVIYNRLRREDRQKIDAALAFMVDGGVALKEELKHPRNGKSYEVFRLNSQA